MSAVQHSKPKASATQRATYFVYRTPLGRVTLGCDGQALTRVAFGVAEFEGEYRPCALTNKASSEILDTLLKSVPYLPFLFILKEAVFRKRCGTMCVPFLMDKLRRTLRLRQT